MCATNAHNKAMKDACSTTAKNRKRKYRRHLLTTQNLASVRRRFGARPVLELASMFAGSRRVARHYLFTRLWFTYTYLCLLYIYPLTYIPTCLPSNAHAYLPTSLPTKLSTYQPSNRPTNRPTAQLIDYFQHIYLHTNQPIYLPTSLPIPSGHLQELCDNETHITCGVNINKQGETSLSSYVLR